MRALAGAALLATATGCGVKHDPYAASLAKGSEHVRITAHLSHQTIIAEGDFTNTPDRGQYTFVAGGVNHRQVFAGGRLYVFAFGKWLSARLTVHTPQTPAQMFRAHLPATIENGLVRSITVHNERGTATYDFSRYGEHVSITVPRGKGAL